MEPMGMYASMYVKVHTDVELRDDAYACAE